MFVKFKYKSLCEAYIRKVVNRHNIKIHVLSVMPDHVHILVTLPKGMNEEKALQLLKGASAYFFFHNHPKYASNIFKGICREERWLPRNNS